METKWTRRVAVAVFGAFLANTIPAPGWALSEKDVRKGKISDTRPLNKAKGDGRIKVGGDPMDPGRYQREVAMGIAPDPYPLPRDTYAEVGARHARWSGTLPAGTEVIPRWVASQKVWLADYVKECGNTVENRIVLDLPPPREPEPRVVERVVEKQPIIINQPPLQQQQQQQMAAPSAPPVNGVCGPNSGRVFKKLPPGGLCAAGSLGGVSDVGDDWAWSCLGLNGGAPANCWATYEKPPEQPMKAAPSEKESDCFIPATESFAGAGGTTFGGATLLSGVLNPWVAGGILVGGLVLSAHSIFSKGDPRCKALGGLVGGTLGALGAGYAVREHQQREERRIRNEQREDRFVRPIEQPEQAVIIKPVKPVKENVVIVKPPVPAPVKNVKYPPVPYPEDRVVVVNPPPAPPPQQQYPQIPVPIAVPISGSPIGTTPIPGNAYVPQYNSNYGGNAYSTSSAPYGYGTGSSSSQSYQPAVPGYGYGSGSGFGGAPPPAPAPGSGGSGYYYGSVGGGGIPAVP